MTGQAPARWTERVARYLSIIGHPFAAIPASVGALCLLRGGDVRMAAGIALAFVAASLAVLGGVWAGWFNNFDVSQRERRPAFYLLAIGAAVCLTLWLRDEPVALRACAVAVAVLLACGVTNRWTKASLHTAFALYVAGLWGTWSLAAGLVALPLAVAVAWSRVRLGRHSRSEVLAGAAVGLAAAASLVWLARAG